MFEAGTTVISWWSQSLEHGDRGRHRRIGSARRLSGMGPVFALVSGMLAIAAFPGAVSAEERCAGAAPLRIANLSPFHIPYRVPASFGACVLPPGASEVIAALDIASHMDAAASGSERLSADGETWRPSLAVRRGLAEGWEYWFELSAVSHNKGAFDGFIETWHDIFGLPQGGRDTAPRDRLAIAYAKDGTARADIDRATASPGDVALGIGQAVEFRWNDGLALRAAVTLPTGDEDALAGAGGPSAAFWAETSGSLSGPRAWLWGATLGGLATTPPSGLADGRRFVVFGRLGLTWRPSPALSLKVQADVHSPPWRSALAPLGRPAVMFGMGGTVKLGARTALEIAVVEDDGIDRAAPDVGVRIALRWRP